MAAHAALRMNRLLGDLAQRQTGSGSGNDGIHRSKLLNGSQHALLDGTLRATLLNELRILHSLFHAGSEVDAGLDSGSISNRAGLGQELQVALNGLLIVGDALVIDVVQIDIQALHREENSPAAADNAAADTGNSLDIFNFHVFSPQRFYSE